MNSRDSQLDMPVASPQKPSNRAIPHHQAGNSKRMSQGERGHCQEQASPASLRNTPSRALRNSERSGRECHTPQRCAPGRDLRTSSDLPRRVDCATEQGSSRISRSISAPQQRPPSAQVSPADVACPRQEAHIGNQPRPSSSMWGVQRNWGSAVGVDPRAGYRQLEAAPSAAAAAAVAAAEAAWKSGALSCEDRQKGDRDKPFDSRTEELRALQCSLSYETLLARCNPQHGNTSNDLCDGGWDAQTSTCSSTSVDENSTRNAWVYSPIARRNSDPGFACAQEAMEAGDTPPTPSECNGIPGEVDGRQVPGTSDTTRDTDLEPSDNRVEAERGGTIPSTAVQVGEEELKVQMLGEAQVGTLDPCPNPDARQARCSLSETLITQSDWDSLALSSTTASMASGALNASHYFPKDFHTKVAMKMDSGSNTTVLAAPVDDASTETPTTSSCQDLPVRHCAVEPIRKQPAGTYGMSLGAICSLLSGKDEHLPLYTAQHVEKRDKSVAEVHCSLKEIAQCSVVMADQASRGPGCIGRGDMEGSDCAGTRSPDSPMWFTPVAATSESKDQVATFSGGSPSTFIELNGSQEFQSPRMANLSFGSASDSSPKDHLPERRSLDAKLSGTLEGDSCGQCKYSENADLAPPFPWPPRLALHRPGGSSSVDVLHDSTSAADEKGPSNTRLAISGTSSCEAAIAENGRFTLASPGAMAAAIREAAGHKMMEHSTEKPASNCRASGELSKADTVRGPCEAKTPGPQRRSSPEPRVMPQNSGTGVQSPGETGRRYSVTPKRSARNSASKPRDVDQRRSVAMGTHGPSNGQTERERSGRSETRSALPSSSPRQSITPRRSVRISGGRDSPQASIRRPALQRSDAELRFRGAALSTSGQLSNIVGDTSEPVDVAFCAAVAKFGGTATGATLPGGEFERLGAGRFRYKGHRVFCRLDQDGHLVARRGSEFIAIHQFLDYLARLER